MQYVPLWTTILRSRKVFNLDDASFRFWVNCLALAQDHDQRQGTLPDLDTIAFVLHLSDDETEALMKKLVLGGLIDDNEGTYVVHNWDKWRYKRDPTAADRKRKQRDLKKSNVTAVTDVTVVTRDARDLRIQYSTDQTEQKAGKPATHARAREAALEPEIVPLPKATSSAPSNPMPDEGMTGRTGQDHADFIRAIEILNSHQTTRRLGADLGMYADTPGVRMIQGWQFIVGAMTAQRPDKTRTWGALMAFCRNATQAELDKITSQAPARLVAANLPAQSDEELRAQTDAANRKAQEYRARKRAES